MVSTVGLVITNAHVVSDSGPIRITLSDNRTVYADVVFEDAAVDLALLRTSAALPAAAPLTDTSNLRVGDPVLVMGFALDLPGEPTISRGVFSSRRSDVSANRVEYLQTDAAMNPGVSGGPMLNMTGEVVGINTWGITRTASGAAVQGVNFAIPVDVALAFIQGQPTVSIVAMAPTGSVPQAFWTVCVWCDAGSHDPRSGAVKVADDLRSAGLPAAVLWSTDYPSLNPDYWITVSGLFGSEQLAHDHAAVVSSAGFAARVRWLGTQVLQGSPATAPAFWTTIVASVRSQADAESAAAQLRAAGQLGEVLFSSDYSSLNPGYWIALSGRFDSRSAADNQTRRLNTGGFVGSYTREVKR